MRTLDPVLKKNIQYICKPVQYIVYGIGFGRVLKPSGVFARWFTLKRRMDLFQVHLQVMAIIDLHRSSAFFLCISTAGWYLALVSRMMEASVQGAYQRPTRPGARQRVLTKGADVLVPHG